MVGGMRIRGERESSALEARDVLSLDIRLEEEEEEEDAVLTSNPVSAGRRGVTTLSFDTGSKEIATGTYRVLGSSMSDAYSRGFRGLSPNNTPSSEAKSNATGPSPAVAAPVLVTAAAVAAAAVADVALAASVVVLSEAAAPEGRSNGLDTLRSRAAASFSSLLTTASGENGTEHVSATAERKMIVRHFVFSIVVFGGEGDVSLPWTKYTNITATNLS